MMRKCQMPNAECQMSIANCQLPIADWKFQTRVSLFFHSAFGIWHSAFWRRLHADRAGALATEYLLIMALIILPLALLTPMFMNMMQVYAARMIFLIGLPFP